MALRIQANRQTPEGAARDVDVELRMDQFPVELRHGALEDLATKLRVRELKNLLTHLDVADKSVDGDREEFTNLFERAVRILEVDDDALARLLKTSRPTISRWRSGQSAPHPLGRPSVFRELRQLARDKIRIRAGGAEKTLLNRQDTEDVVTVQVDFHAVQTGLAAQQLPSTAATHGDSTVNG